MVLCLANLRATGALLSVAMAGEPISFSDLTLCPKQNLEVFTREREFEFCFSDSNSWAMHLAVIIVFGSFSQKQVLAFLRLSYPCKGRFYKSLSSSYLNWYLKSLKLIQNHLITISNEFKGNLFIDHYTYSSNRKSIPAVAIRDRSVIRFLSKCLK